MYPASFKCMPDVWDLAARSEPAKSQNDILRDSFDYLTSKHLIFKFVLISIYKIFPKGQT